MWASERVALLIGPHASPSHLYQSSGLATAPPGRLSCSGTGSGRECSSAFQGGSPAGRYLMPRLASIMPSPCASSAFHNELSAPQTQTHHTGTWCGVTWASKCERLVCDDLSNTMPEAPAHGTFMLASAHGRGPRGIPVCCRNALGCSLLKLVKLETRSCTSGMRAACSDALFKVASSLTTEALPVVSWPLIQPGSSCNGLLHASASNFQALKPGPPPGRSHAPTSRASTSSPAACSRRVAATAFSSSARGSF